MQTKAPDWANFCHGLQCAAGAAAHGAGYGYDNYHDWIRSNKITQVPEDARHYWRLGWLWAEYRDGNTVEGCTDSGRYRYINISLAEKVTAVARLDLINGSWSARIGDFRWPSSWTWIIMSSSFTSQAVAAALFPVLAKQFRREG